MRRRVCADGKCWIHGFVFFPKSSDNVSPEFSRHRLWDIEECEKRKLRVQEFDLSDCFLEVEDSVWTGALYPSYVHVLGFTKLNCVHGVILQSLTWDTAPGGGRKMSLASTKSSKELLMVFHPKMQKGLSLTSRSRES